MSTGSSAASRCESLTGWYRSRSRPTSPLKAGLAAAFLLAAAAPASATAWLHCADAGETVGIGLLLGSHQVLSAVAVTVTLGDRSWVTDPAYGAGEPITVGQGFASEDALVLDLLDADFNLFVAELRLFRTAEGDDFVHGGTLRLHGHGAWAVACEGP